MTATHPPSQTASHVSVLTPSQGSVNAVTLLSLTKTIEKIVQALDRVGIIVDKDSVYEQEKINKFRIAQWQKAMHHCHPWVTKTLNQNK